jgi:D-alanine-D-alanine ligase
MKPLIGLVYDLRKDYLAKGLSEEDIAEFDSEETIEALHHTIEKLGYRVDRIGNGKALSARLAAGQRWDVVFNIAEGLGGRCRESYVPALLELYEIPYTFSDPLVCALTLDKALAKSVISANGLRTAPFKVIEKIEDIDGLKLQYPLFAKPIAEGTGKGVNENSLVDNPEKLKKVCEYLLKKFTQPVLVEEFLPGREFTVGVVGNNCKSVVLGIMEVEVPGDSNGIYSLQAKEECEKLVKYKPFRNGLLYNELKKLAIESYRVLRCRDAARVDIRCDAAGRPCFLEINPLPGLHPTHSDLPMIATQQGLSYSDLIGLIINSALTRTNGSGVK